MKIDRKPIWVPENEYLDTVKIGNFTIELAKEAIGQNYYYEAEGPRGGHKQGSLGTYNIHYLEDLYIIFDEVFNELNHKYLCGENMSLREEFKYKEYMNMFYKR